MRVIYVYFVFRRAYYQFNDSKINAQIEYFVRRKTNFETFNAVF